MDGVSIAETSAVLTCSYAPWNSGVITEDDPDLTLVDVSEVEEDEEAMETTLEREFWRLFTTKPWVLFRVRKMAVATAANFILYLYMAWKSGGSIGSAKKRMN
jgi:hypothetical protein